VALAPARRRHRSPPLTSSEHQCSRRLTTRRHSNGSRNRSRWATSESALRCFLPRP